MGGVGGKWQKVTKKVGQVLCMDGLVMYVFVRNLGAVGNLSAPRSPLPWVADAQSYTVKSKVS